MADQVQASFDVPADPGPSEQQAADGPAATGNGSSNAIGERLVPDFKVKLNGSPLASPLLECLQQVEIQQSVKLLDMAMLSFDNPKGIIGDADELAIGVEVEIEIGYVGEVSACFKGDLVALEPLFPVTGTPSVTVYAYDKGHRYQRGSHQKTFLAQKVSDVVSALAGEEGLSADVEDTKTQHEYLLQNNQSNIALITELARKEGYEARVLEGNKLSFKKPSASEAKAETLEWGKSLKSFYVRSSVGNMPTEVTTHFWDMAQKKTVEEKNSTIENDMGSTDTAASVAEKAFGKAEQHITLRPCMSPAEGQALAAARFNEAAMESVRARGTCVGEPAIKPGVVLELLGLGKIWSGLYYITGVTQLLHREAGFATAFEGCRSGTGYDNENVIIEEPEAPPVEESEVEEVGRLSLSASVSE